MFFSKVKPLTSLPPWISGRIVCSFVRKKTRMPGFVLNEAKPVVMSSRLTRCDCSSFGNEVIPVEALIVKCCFSLVSANVIFS